MRTIKSHRELHFSDKTVMINHKTVLLDCFNNSSPKTKKDFCQLSKLSNVTHNNHKQSSHITIKLSSKRYLHFFCDVPPSRWINNKKVGSRLINVYAYTTTSGRFVGRSHIVDVDTFVPGCLFDGDTYLLFGILETSSTAARKKKIERMWNERKCVQSCASWRSGIKLNRVLFCVVFGGFGGIKGN